MYKDLINKTVSVSYYNFHNIDGLHTNKQFLNLDLPLQTSSRNVSEFSLTFHTAR